MPTTTQNNPMDVNTLINNLKLIKGNFKIKTIDPINNKAYYLYSLTIEECEVTLDWLEMPEEYNSCDNLETNILEE